MGVLLARGARGGDENSGVEIKDAQGLHKPRCPMEQEAWVRQRQLWLLNTGQQFKDKKMSRCCKALQLPSTNQARGSPRAALGMACSSRHRQTAQEDVSFAKGLQENSRETSPPSQAPPEATRRKLLSWPDPAALAGLEAHSPEPRGPVPSGSIPTAGTTSPSRSQIVEGTITPVKVSSAWITPDHKQRGQDQKLTECRTPGAVLLPACTK